MRWQRIAASGSRPRNLTSPVEHAFPSMGSRGSRAASHWPHWVTCPTWLWLARLADASLSAWPWSPYALKQRGWRDEECSFPEGKNRSGALWIPGSKYWEARRGFYSPSSTFCFYRRGRKGLRNPLPSWDLSGIKEENSPSPVMQTSGRKRSWWRNPRMFISLSPTSLS